jgi:SUR7/PalI family
MCYFCLFLTRTRLLCGVVWYLVRRSSSLQARRESNICPRRAYCYETTKSSNTICDKTGHAYSLVFNSNASSVTIGSSWTRGLAVHPVGMHSPILDEYYLANFKLPPSATGVIFIALLLSLSSHITVTLLASIVSFLAALITLIAFAIDIALFAFVKHEMKKLTGVSSNTNTAPGQSYQIL